MHSNTASNLVHAITTMSFGVSHSAAATNTNAQQQFQDPVHARCGSPPLQGKLKSALLVTAVTGVLEFIQLYSNPAQMHSNNA